MNELVSIIMLSKNNEQFAVDSVKSVINQTYQNWELLIVDDGSIDGTITQLLELRGHDKRIKVSQFVFERGSGINRNSALKEAKGKWVAFLDAGDLWEPTKLEKQLNFMVENGYGYSYTSYSPIHNSDISISGPQHLTRKDMLKNCWPEYLTVMYYTEKVGQVQVRYLKDNSDYALLLQVSEKLDCYLLDENLASRRGQPKSWFQYPPNRRFMWRYEVYRKVENFNPITSFWYTCRNIIYGFIKKRKYVKHV